MIEYDKEMKISVWDNIMIYVKEFTILKKYVIKIGKLDNNINRRYKILLLH